MKKIIILILCVFTSGLISAQSKVIPYTTDDKATLIRVEEKLSVLEEKMDTKFEAVNVKIESLEKRFDKRFEQVDNRFEQVDNRFDHFDKRMDQQMNLFFWGFGVMITFMFFMLGYIIWDRRTALYPVKEKADTLENKSSVVFTILREYANTHPDLAKILKIHGLL